MLHACAGRFDVMENLENFLVFRWTKQGRSEEEEDDDDDEDLVSAAQSAP